MNYIIVGSGVAGLSACEAIRSLDTASEIYMLGDDPNGYYSRPGLAYYLTGEMPEQGLFPRTKREWLSLDLRFVRGRATRIYPEEHKVEVDHQTQLEYDRLLIAVGAQATRLNVPGADLEGVVKLDHMEDARKILQLARRGKSAVVVGGGITALELVEGLRSRGVKAHYLLRGDRYWSNVLDAQESKIIEHRLREEGVTLHYHAELKEILGVRGKVRGRACRMVQRCAVISSHTQSGSARGWGWRRMQSWRSIAAFWSMSIYNPAARAFTQQGMWPRFTIR
jgi:NADPH-dependent 2,4-dienoyl-CoA reductase/sulfur reductase-like enzyme